MCGAYWELSLNYPKLWAVLWSCRETGNRYRLKFHQGYSESFKVVCYISITNNIPQPYLFYSGIITAYTICAVKSASCRAFWALILGTYLCQRICGDRFVRATVWEFQCNHWTCWNSGVGLTYRHHSHKLEIASKNFILDTKQSKCTVISYLGQILGIMQELGVFWQHHGTLKR